MDHKEELDQSSRGRRPSRCYAEPAKLAHVKAWKLSGLSIREYCHQHMITVSAFYQWRRRLLRNDGDSVSAALAPDRGKFIPVLPVESQVSNGQVSWDLPNNLGRVSGGPAAMYHLIKQMRQEGW